MSRLTSATYREASRSASISRADRPAYLPFVGPDSPLEDVRRRMRGVGRHQQHPPAAAARRQRERRRAGRLADSPFAAEKHDVAVEQRDHRQEH